MMLLLFSWATQMRCFYRHFIVFGLPKDSQLKTNIHTDFKFTYPLPKNYWMGILMPSILNAYRAGVLFHFFFWMMPPPCCNRVFPRVLPPGTGSDKVQQHWHLWQNVAMSHRDESQCDRTMGSDPQKNHQVKQIQVVILLMAEILHHLGCMKPSKYWDIYHMNWCRISAINSITIWLKGRWWNTNSQPPGHWRLEQWPSMSQKGKVPLVPRFQNMRQQQKTGGFSYLNA